ncbi:hypothetical protein J9303_04515 [Bacillaceae bacterium Marseille-Q3522]|nr:hypothetical protein [Bacillaceae bacterium Marseille-Q3522]
MPVHHLCEHQVFTSEENIFLTAGAQQALSILAKMPFLNNKQTVLVEQSTYELIQELIIQSGIKLVGIERSEQGIDVVELERIFR